MKTSNKQNTKVQNEQIDLSTLTTTSSKIRHLSSLGKTRVEIVKIISEHQGRPIRYQHVRNVLEQPLKKVQ